MSPWKRNLRLHYEQCEREGSMSEPLNIRQVGNGIFYSMITSIMVPSVQKDWRATSMMPLYLVGTYSMYKAIGTCAPPKPTPTKNRRARRACRTSSETEHSSSVWMLCKFGTEVKPSFVRIASVLRALHNPDTAVGPSLMMAAYWEYWEIQDWAIIWYPVCNFVAFIAEAAYRFRAELPDKATGLSNAKCHLEGVKKNLLQRTIPAFVSAVLSQ